MLIAIIGGVCLLAIIVGVVYVLIKTDGGYPGCDKHYSEKEWNEKVHGPTGKPDYPPAIGYMDPYTGVFIYESTIPPEDTEEES